MSAQWSRSRSRSRTRTRARARRGVVAFAVALVAAGSCRLDAPYARTNPFDPDAELALTLVGPDSAHAIGERITFTVASDPPLRPAERFVSWRSGDPIRLIAGADGEYVVQPPVTAAYAPVQVTAAFNSVLVTKWIMVGQRAAVLQLACGTAGSPVACDAVVRAPGQVVPVFATMRDANTNTLKDPAAAMGRATTASRDGAVATWSVVPNASGRFDLVTVGPGATWMVVTLDGVRDSVRVVVGP